MKRTRPSVKHVDFDCSPGSFPDDNSVYAFFHFEYRGVDFRITPTGDRWLIEKKLERGSGYMVVRHQTPHVTFTSPRSAFKYLRMIFDRSFQYTQVPGYLNRRSSLI